MPRNENEATMMPHEEEEARTIPRGEGQRGRDNDGYGASQCGTLSNRPPCTYFKVRTVGGNLTPKKGVIYMSTF